MPRIKCPGQLYPFTLTPEKSTARSASDILTICEISLPVTSPRLSEAPYRCLRQQRRTRALRRVSPMRFSEQRVQDERTITPIFMKVYISLCDIMPAKGRYHALS